VSLIPDTRLAPYELDAPIGAGGMGELVMPCLDGETLAARLESGPLPLDQTLTIAREIADAPTRRTGTALRIATSSRPASC
jgi:hypothetical protein